MYTGPRDDQVGPVGRKFSQVFGQCWAPIVTKCPKLKLLTREQLVFGIFDCLDIFVEVLCIFDSVCPL